ncbi:MAG: hypothetical protein AAF568_11270, partial [Pseudomonadota bacterium]
MLSIGIAGLGAIGMKVAETLDREELPGMGLTAVAASTPERAAEKTAGLRTPPRAVAATDLAAHADIVIECAPKAIFAPLARSVIEAGRTFMPLSCGALLDEPDLIARAAETGARILVPTGALIALADLAFCHGADRVEADQGARGNQDARTGLGRPGDEVGLIEEGAAGERHEGAACLDHRAGE